MFSIFSDSLENCTNVFMDDFTMYGSSFDVCLDSLERVLNRCIQTNLVQNFEKCHFMVEHGIVLRYIISSKGIEVDPTKIFVISQLPYPLLCERLILFLAMLGFTCALSRTLARQPSHCPSCCKGMLTSSLIKGVDFIFDEGCKKAFNFLKKALTTTLIIQVPDWTTPFELMCNA